MDALTAARIQTVRDHMRLECESDWDAVIATFAHPRYELYGADPARFVQRADQGTLDIETNIVSGKVDLAALESATCTFDGGGLGRQLSVYRLPEADWSRQVMLDHTVSFGGGADLPVYLRVTQADGHQAWSSPIYLIA